MDTKSDASGICLDSGPNIYFGDSLIEFEGSELRKFILANIDQPFQIRNDLIPIHDAVKFLSPIKDIVEDIFLIDFDKFSMMTLEFQKMNIDITVSRQFKISEDEEMKSFSIVDFDESKTGRLCLRKSGSIEMADGMVIPISYGFTLYEVISVLTSELPEIFEGFSKDSFQL